MRQAFRHAMVLATTILFIEAAGLAGGVARANPTSSDYFFNPQAVAIQWTYTTGAVGPYTANLYIYVNGALAGNYSVTNIPSNYQRTDFVGAQKPASGSTYYSVLEIIDATNVKLTYVSGSYTVP